jgi:hypothetical protein
MTRVARWYIYQPKSQIWVNFEGSGNGRYLYMLWFCGHFGIFSRYLVYFYRFGKKKNLATLLMTSAANVLSNCTQAS